MDLIYSLTQLLAFLLVLREPTLTLSTTYVKNVTINVPLASVLTQTNAFLVLKPSSKKEIFAAEFALEENGETVHSESVNRAHSLAIRAMHQALPMTATHV